MSDSLQPHGLQHARLPCPSPSPVVCSNSCPWSLWCHPTISSSVIPFSSCLQSFPASGSFPTSRFFASGGQSIGASASALVLPIQGWFPLGLTGLISLQFKALLKVFSSTTVQKLAAGLGHFPIAQGWEGAPVFSWGPRLTENLKEHRVACPLGDLTPSPFVSVPFSH